MLVFRGMWRAGWVHLCRAPQDRLAMRQQHFLPLLQSLAITLHLLLPRLACTILTWTSDSQVRECEPDGQAQA